MNDWTNVVLVDMVRLPIGRFGGSLSSLTAQELGARAIRALMERTGLGNEEVDEVILGHCRQSGTGPNPARQAAVMAGLSPKVPAFTVNKACPSALRAAILGAKAILLGEAKAVIAGGMESMSNMPYLLNIRFKGAPRLGNLTLVDDWNTVRGLAGMTPLEGAEYIRKKYNISRQELDEFALESQLKARKAWEEGVYYDHVVPVDVADPKGKGAFRLERDETFRETSLEALAALPPASPTVEAITAGNSCGMGDCAGVLLLMDRDHAARLGFKPKAALVCAAVAAAPDIRDMFEGPALSIPLALQKAGLRLEEIDFIEVNEAFASQVLANERVLGWDRKKLNIYGGAIALSHPTGFSGARLVMDVVTALHREGGNYGVTAICGGDGIGVTAVWRREG